MLIMHRPVTLEKGFTLIELAVVLVIIGILIGSFIGTLGSRIDNTRRIEAQEALDDIRITLYGYAMSQSPVRLPCPDIDNDGLEDVTAGQCNALTTHGNLPWATLGVERGDAWASTYSYWVADEYSNLAGFNLTTNASNVGRIEDSTGGNLISNNVAAVIFSHGKNQYGSISVENDARPAVPANTAGSNYDDERENQDTDAAAPVLFISRPVTDENAAIVFDDILVWISEYELKGRMVQAGVLPP
jgi:prepilin-type N-terminal cleavage/methylation domain-containing protein